MATLVQSKTLVHNASVISEASVTLDAQPAAGNLLVAVAATDKDAGDWLATPEDWNPLMAQAGTSVSTAAAWRAASGDEPLDVRFEWRIPRQWVSVLVAELSGITDPVLDVAAFVRAYSDTAVTSFQLGPVGPSSAAGAAVAMVSIDSAQGIWNPTATGYTQHALAIGAGTQPGVALLEKATGSGATETPTIASGGVTDQKSGVLALFKAGAPAVPVWTEDPEIDSRWGVAETGMELTCTPGAVTGTPTPLRSYQWKRDGANISGATARTYTLQAADEGSDVTCTVVASNSEGSDTATTAALAATAPTPHADLGPWSGGQTQTRIRVAYKLTLGDDARLAVSTSPDLSGATYGSSVAVPADGLVVLEKTGLSADTYYYYGVEVDGALVPDSESRGEFRTLAAEGTSKDFKMWWGSCILPHADPSTFTSIAASGALFGEQCGDFHYGDHSGETETARGLIEGEWDSVMGRSRLAAMLRKMPVGHSWDDHDFTGNGSSGQGVPNRIVQQVERHRVPSHDLPDLTTDGGIYRSYVCGRVRVVVIDTRTYRSPQNQTDDESKVLLGASQEAWFKAECLAAKAAGQFVCWVGSMVWHSNLTDDDVWAEYDTERQRLIDWFAANEIVNIMYFGGDAHMIAADDGTNSPGGIATAQAAGLGNFGAFKGGPWSQGHNENPNKFGLITYTFDGDTLTVLTELKGEFGATEITMTRQFELGAVDQPPDPVPRIVKLNGQLVELA